MGIETAIIGSAILGAAASSRAAKTAAGATERAAQQSADVQERMFERQVELQEPWRQAGQQALNKLIPLASEYTPFGMEQLQADPGYAFRLAEGQKALERQAAARGGLISGSALKAAQRYGQEMGSQEYTNAFNRYQAERAARLNPLQSLAGMGQTAANQLGGAAGQLGADLGRTYLTAGTAAGQTRASSYLGTANALQRGIGQYYGYQQDQALINALRNRGVGTVPPQSGIYGSDGVAPQGAIYGGDYYG